MKNKNLIQLNIKEISNLALNLISKKQYEKAERLLIESLKKIDNNHYLFNHLGYLYFEKGDLDNSIKYYNQSIKIEKNNKEAYCNMGTAYLFKNEYKLSKEIFDMGLKFLPDNENILIAYSQLLFATKNIEQAFKAFENRKKTKQYLSILSKLTMKEWNGENLNGKSILILSEQGIGDIIQFSRYLLELQKKFSVKIIFKLRPKLHYLFKNFKFQIIGPQDEIPNADYYQCLMTLPGIFHKLENKLISNYDYIKRNKNLAIHWKKEIGLTDNYNIGLCWQGDPAYGRDFMRSIPLKKFEKLFLVPNLNFINLTKGIGNEQIKNFKFKDKIKDFSSKIDNGDNSFEDTIAILENINLLITSDTALAHVASTMNVKTWLLLDYSADWRWHLETKKFKWYDSQIIFRQTKIFSWDEVINQVLLRLEKYKF
tara:strand:+ start:485 stop:1765 length:1281 start_codon:yes stop_codon:yes gene_type:complete